MLGGSIMQNPQQAQKQLPVSQLGGVGSLTNNQPFVSVVQSSSNAPPGIIAQAQLQPPIGSMPLAINSGGGVGMGEFPPQMLLSSGQGNVPMMPNGIGIGVPLSMQQGAPMINGQQNQQQLSQGGLIIGGMPNSQMGGGVNPTNINQGQGQGQSKHYMPPQGQQQMQQQMYQPQHMQQQQQHQQQQQQQQQRVLSNGQLPQGQGQQQQQMTLSGTRPVRKSWHTQEDASTRNSMIERIVGLLQQRRPNATSDWQEKLPHMAKRLENELYQQAESVAEYSDPLTLKNRLQLLALSMGTKQAAKQSLISGSGQPMVQGQGPGQVSNLIGMAQGQGLQGQQQQIQGQVQGQYTSQQQQSQSQMMQQQHQQHLHLQLQQSQQNPGTHMRTAQAAASQYPGPMGQGGPQGGNGYGYNTNGVMDSQGQHPQQQQQQQVRRINQCLN